MELIGCEYFQFGCKIPEMRTSCQYSLSQEGPQNGEGIRPIVNQLKARFPKPGHGGAEEGSLIVSFLLSLINMSHSMYSVKNSHHPNNTAPDRITSVAPLLLGAVKDVTSTFYQF